MGLAQSPILVTTIILDRSCKRGYMNNIKLNLLFASNF